MDHQEFNSPAPRGNSIQNGSTCASTPRSVSRKRPASLSPQAGAQSPPTSAPHGDKRPRLSPTQDSVVEGSNLPSVPSPTPPQMSINVQKSIPRAAAPLLATPPQLRSNIQRNESAHMISTLPINAKLRAKLSSYSYANDERAEILVVSDSILRFVKLPRAVNYVLSGGKTTDFIEMIPALLDVHHEVHTVFIHTGTNDEMNRQNAKLHADLKALVVTIQSLGRRCVLSGPIPALYKSDEYFSRLAQLNTWMLNYSRTEDVHYINNFDYYWWTQRDLFKMDGLHPSKKGTNKLSLKFINFIAFQLLK